MPQGSKPQNSKEGGSSAPAPADAVAVLTGLAGQEQVPPVARAALGSVAWMEGILEDLKTGGAASTPTQPGHHPVSPSTTGGAGMWTRPTPRRAPLIFSQAAVGLFGLVIRGGLSPFATGLRWAQQMLRRIIRA
jgi:hypothetical protein